MKDPQIKIKQTDLLSDNHYILNKVTFDYQKNDDSWITQKERFMTEKWICNTTLQHKTKNSHSNSSVSFTNVPQRKQNRDDD
jgi:ribonuclease HI